MRKILCIVDGKRIWSITSIPYSHQYELPNLCWYYLGGYFLPFSLLHCRFSFENNWRQASGSRHFWSSARDMISYYKISGYRPYQSVQYWKFVSKKEEPIHLLSCLQVTVGVLRVLWGWKLFWTREYKDSVGESLKKFYSI